ncbi:MAG: hypothetical protein MUD12_17055 [Spirochaetes bacterium]|jgi:hypothetical protein|nr:hypothetical protein [Spirochaetota bacterium]
MKMFYLFVISLVAVFMATTADCGSAKKRITEKEAVALARDYLVKQEHASLYELDSPHVTSRGDEYYVQFNDKRRHVKPGVCIVSVHKYTGTLKYVPVE